MILFRKERFSNGRRHIYFCGLKIASYRHKKHRVLNGLISCDIYNFDNLVKSGTKFPHLLGIVISRYATVGNNCTIYQNVTIGTKYNSKTQKTDYPTIGDNVIIYAGAVIVGPVKIGNNVIVGANSVVLHDVPNNCVVAGIPAKIISKNRGTK